MRAALHLPRTVLTGIAVALVAVLVVAVLARGTATDRTDLVGVFVDASPLEVGSEVRASGVKVGEVTSIELDGSVARVGLDVEDGVLPVHRDARMVIKPINLLGENYVDLVPGSADAGDLDGDVVPVEQTETAVTLQAVLDTFDDPTSAALAALVAEAGTGLTGSGEQVAEALSALAPAMGEIDELGDVLREQNAALGSLVESADPVAAALVRDGGADLDRLLAATETALGTLAANQQGIEATVAELPGTLAEAQATFVALDELSTQLTPVLDELRPVTDDLDVIAGEIDVFADEATPAFNSFDEVFAEADRLLVEAAPVAEQLRASGADLQGTAAGLEPVGEVLLDAHLDDLMQFVRKWALSTNGRDAYGHYFRGVFHVTPASLNALLGVDALPELNLPDPFAGGQTPGDGDLVTLPDPGTVLDQSGELVEGTLGQLDTDDPDHVLGGLLGNLGSLFQPQAGPTPPAASRQQSGTTSNPGSGGATGLDATQERNLLGMLLGGQR
ncbi:MlaD family protein [Nocardioides zeae]|uniref:MCE family protein n=1 Tax=Nocardioides zeae TaxID=1457234 RepID=A0A6P0HGQ5_9ACTN|nr:MlaD family protein [Nocardioides zeae]NEN77872.1 MCE family protein [Nocardioides zeae]